MAKINRLCSVVGCDSPATDKHHIGGHSSPMIWVCKNCHGKIHGVVWRSDLSHLTKLGLERARAAGRIGGNPGLRAGDPDALHKMRVSRNAHDKERTLAASAAWIPTLVAMRPLYSWKETATALGTTQERLRRTVKKLIAWGLVEAGVMARTERKAPASRRLVPIIKALAPGLTLQQIGAKLEEMEIRTSKGGTRWHASSVRFLLLQAGIPASKDHP